METKNWAKLVIAVAAAAYFIGCAFNPVAWHFIDGVNLLIHEAGHWIFSPFGMFMTVLGGSLLQVLVPALFVAYFYRQGQFYSAALVLFWVGQSLLNVSSYAADAVRMQLPLLGGENTVHDWNWLLVYTGQLRHAAGIALTMRIMATLIVIAAAAWSIKRSLGGAEEVGI